jgi:hypothetical protein
MMTNVALVEPSGTATALGTEAALLLSLESDTVVPRTQGAVVNVTVPIEIAPPITSIGFKVRL